MNKERTKAVSDTIEWMKQQKRYNDRLIPDWQIEEYKEYMEDE